MQDHHLKASLIVGLILCASAAVWAQSSVEREIGLPANQHNLASDGHVVVLLDKNPHQEKVLPIELALAKSVVQKLDMPESTFSLIVFGSQPPALLKQRVTATEVITAIESVSVEQPQKQSFSVHSYDAIKMGIDQFTGDSRPQSLLIVSEGNDYFPRKTFKETVKRANQMRLAFDVAMVADHTLYGSKGIQHYGFDLRNLARKTHGQYVELGGKGSKVSRSAAWICEGILRRGWNQSKPAQSPVSEPRELCLRIAPGHEQQVAQLTKWRCDWFKACREKFSEER